MKAEGKTDQKKSSVGHGAFHSITYHDHVMNTDQVGPNQKVKETRVPSGVITARSHTGMGVGRSELVWQPVPCTLHLRGAPSFFSGKFTAMLS